MDSELELKVVILLADSYDDLGKLEDLGVELAEAEEIMLNHNYERCPECEMWVECGELIGENDEPTVCSSCQ